MNATNKNNMITLTKEERNEIVALLEQAANRPASKFHTLVDEYNMISRIRSKMSGRDEGDAEQERGTTDYIEDDLSMGDEPELPIQEVEALFEGDSELRKEKRYNFVPVKLPTEVVHAIWKAYNSDDEQLREWALYFVLANMRVTVAHLASKFEAGSDLREEFLSEAKIQIVSNLPAFDGTRGIQFTTFFSRWIRRAYSDTIRQANQSSSTRYYYETSNDIKRAVFGWNKMLKNTESVYVPGLHDLGITKPNEMQICAYINEYIRPNAKKPLSVISVINCLEQEMQGVSLDALLEESDENAQQGYTNRLIDEDIFGTASTFERPEAAAVRLGLQEEVQTLIKNLDPRRRRVLEVRYEHILSEGEDMPPAALRSALRKDPLFAQMTPTQIDRAVLAANQAVISRFRGSYRPESSVVGGIATSAGWLTEEADMISGSLDEMDLSEVFDFSAKPSA